MLNQGLAGSAMQANAVPVKPALPANDHAQQLHNQADELASLNGRIQNFCDRLTGPIPETAAAGDKQSEPTGVLYVAQFGATRIANGLDRLRELVARLESIA